jgi:epoxide hydrolase-like predicted phosphatase
VFTGGSAARPRASLSIGLVAEPAQVPELSSAELSSAPGLRGVIFDWGGVITNPIIDTVQAWLTADGIDRDSYAAAMRPWVRSAYGPEQRDSPIHALERGEVSDAEFEQALAALLVGLDGGVVPADGLLRRMFAASRVEAEMLDLIRELRGRGLRIGLLSNSWGGGEDSYPRDILDELFDAVVISAQVGMRKPEERIFRLVTDRIGLAPASCVFVDDVEGNITAARSLGFAVVHHRAPAATKAELLDLLAAPAV